MDEKAKAQWELIFAWCGPVFVTTFVFFWGVVAVNIPPAGPSLTASQIAAHYAEHSGMIRTGFILSVIFVSLYLPWTTLLTMQLARREGAYPILSWLQFAGGVLTMMVVSLSGFFWIVAAFRPERSPEITQMLHDAGWLVIDQLYICTTLQMCAAAIVRFHDRSNDPLFPVWAGWLAVWASFTFFPASLTGVLKTGPFAWNGSMSFYVAYAAWLTWFLTFSYYMIADARRRRRRLDHG